MVRVEICEEPLVQAVEIQPGRLKDLFSGVPGGVKFLPVFVTDGGPNSR